MSCVTSSSFLLRYSHIGKISVKFFWGKNRFVASSVEKYCVKRSSHRSHVQTKPISVGQHDKSVWATWTQLETTGFQLWKFTEQQ